MIRLVIGGALAFAFLSAPAFAAPRTSALGWVVTPTETGCRAELELTARSGAVTPVSLNSDGQMISLKFFKEELPARAFLPIRIDRARYSNLVLRGANGAGELVLSEETQNAMRRGSTLDIAWLGEEPLSTSLAGSEQGLVDLKVCGAQAAGRHQAQVAAELDAKERAEAQARAKALNDAQIAAAEAQRRQAELAVQAQQDRAYQEARQPQYPQYQDSARRGYYPPPPPDYDDDRWAPPHRPVWLPPPRYYTPY